MQCNNQPIQPQPALSAAINPKLKLEFALKLEFNAQARVYAQAHAQAFNALSPRTLPFFYPAFYAGLESRHVWQGK